VVYDLLFRASAETLIEVAADPRHLGAQIGFMSVLHTWGQNLLHHPHVHCVIPAGGLAFDRSAWIPSTSKFFLPVKVLSRVFRGKFDAGLKRAFRRGKLSFHGNLTHLSEAKNFRSFRRQLFRHDWVVYAKRPFGGPEHVLHYLARYTHRVAISNHRLVSFEDGRVTFRWKDYAHGGKKREMTISADEFLRRFLLHFFAARLCSHSALRVPDKPASIRIRCPVSAAHRRSSENTAPAEPTCRGPCGHVGLSSMCRPHDHHPAVVRRADPATLRRGGGLH
jgi:hypothetical protein